MYSSISSFKSYLYTKDIKASIFLFLALSMLSASIAAMQGVLAISCVIVVFSIAMFVPSLGKKFTSHPVLLNHQIFYILPLLVSVSLSLKYDFLDCMLQVFAMGCTAMLCSSEIAKANEKLERNQSVFLQIIVALGALVSSSYFLAVVPELTKLSSFVISFSVYLLLESPDKKILAFRVSNFDNKIKIAIFSAGIVAVYGYVSFSNASNFLAYFLYIVLAVNLGFCFRKDKSMFFLFASMILLASLVPFGPVEKYIDNVVLSCAVILFHLNSPILYYKKTQYGVLKVLYRYSDNKMSLINDSIIQGEKFVGVDNRKENLLYFGNSSKNSVIASIFNLFQEKDSKIAVLGLGAGAMAMLGGKNNTIDFYEINPEVVKIAYDRTLFNYLSESESRTSVILGDARSELNKVDSKKYSLIVVDVYLGGDLPNHFFTKEAVQMYMSKLDDEGIVVFHVTNHEGFESKLCQIAEDLNIESAVAYESYIDSEDDKDAQGLLVVPEEDGFKNRISKILSNMKSSNVGGDDDVYGWIVLAKKKGAIKSLVEDKRWFRLENDNKGQGLYTDELIGYNQTKGEITQEVD